jgi:hypothetical protein
MSHFERNFHRTQPRDLRDLPFAEDVIVVNVDAVLGYLTVVALITAAALCFLPNADAATKKEWREQRRAVEVKYQVCMAACDIKCRVAK